MGVHGDRYSDVKHSETGMLTESLWGEQSLLHLLCFSLTSQNSFLLRLASQLSSNHSCLGLHCHAEQCGEVPVPALPTTAEKRTLEKASSQKLQVGKAGFRDFWTPYVHSDLTS